MKEAGSVRMKLSEPLKGIGSTEDEGDGWMEGQKGQQKKTKFLLVRKSCCYVPQSHFIFHAD